MFGAIRRDMKVIGRTIKCMEMEEFNGLMVELMKVNSSMIENMAMEHFVGLMVVSMLANGRAVDSMEQAMYCIAVACARAVGRMENECAENLRARSVLEVQRARTPGL